METKNLNEVLEKYAQKSIIEAAKILKDVKGRDYRIVKKIDYDVYKTPKGPAVKINIPDYGIYIEQGRYPWGKNKGKKISDIPKNQWNKFPPPGPILRWAREKSVDGFRDAKGRFVKKDTTLIFLISRSIAARGIKPKPFLHVFTDNIRDLYLDIGSAAASDLAIELQGAFDKAGIGKES